MRANSPANARPARPRTQRTAINAGRREALDQSTSKRASKEASIGASNVRRRRGIRQPLRTVLNPGCAARQSRRARAMSEVGVLFRGSSEIAALHTVHHIISRVVEECMAINLNGALVRCCDRKAEEERVVSVAVWLWALVFYGDGDG